jgi:hypothetical protein
MIFKQPALRVQEVALCFLRKWTRPITNAGIAAGTVVNLVIIPLWTREVPNLAEGAAWITACAASFIPRTVEKIKGVAAAD